MAKVLLVENHPTFARLYNFYLQSEGHTVIHAADGKLGLVLFKQELPDVVITDIDMPGMSGTQFIQQLQQQYLNTRIIALYFERRETDALSLTTEGVAIASKDLHRQEFLDLVNRELDAIIKKPEPKKSNVDDRQMLPINVAVTDNATIDIYQSSDNDQSSDNTISISPDQIDLLISCLSEAKIEALANKKSA